MPESSSDFDHDYSDLDETYEDGEDDEKLELGDRISELERELESKRSGNNYFWLLVIAALIWAIPAIIKYEGKSSKEWAYDYYDENARHRNFRSCVEDLARSSDYDDLASIYHRCF